MSMSTFAALAQSAASFQLRFESLFNPGRALTFPCDECGKVELDSLSARAAQLPVRPRRGRPRVRHTGGDAGGLMMTGSRQRNALRTTSLRPDQVASTAQTFTSTKPSGKATSRTVSSVMSVATFAAFLGQETQTTASAGKTSR